MWKIHEVLGATEDEWVGRGEQRGRGCSGSWGYFIRLAWSPAAELYIGKQRSSSAVLIKMQPREQRDATNNDKHVETETRSSALLIKLQPREQRDTTKTMMNTSSLSTYAGVCTVDTPYVPTNKRRLLIMRADRQHHTLGQRKKCRHLLEAKLRRPILSKTAHWRRKRPFNSCHCKTSPLLSQPQSAAPKRPFNSCHCKTSPLLSQPQTSCAGVSWPSCTYRVYRVTSAEESQNALISNSLFPVCCFGRTTPLSVTIAVIKLAGVTSNAGFQASIPSGAILCPATDFSSEAGLSSMTMSAPVAVWLVRRG